MSKDLKANHLLQNADSSSTNTTDSAGTGRVKDEIVFVSNDDLPEPVLYADGCVDDTKIIMLCQKQEMERL